MQDFKANTHLGAIIDLLIKGCGIDIPRLFKPEGTDKVSVLRNINSAFLIGLCHKETPLRKEALEYMDRVWKDPSFRDVASFYRDVYPLLVDEFVRFCSMDGNAGRVERLLKGGVIPCHEDFWGIFHPEAVGILEDRDQREEELRMRRRIRITGLNKDPIKDVLREVLFTANVLLTVPPHGRDLDSLFLERGMRERIKKVVEGEDQLYWYDHPVQMGVEFEKDEIIYGLSHLVEALEYERKRGTVKGKGRLTCILSVSVTHRGLQDMAREYIGNRLREVKGLKTLDVYIFTEADTRRLVDEVLVPVVRRYIGDDVDTSSLGEVFGVDGRYGRHYSFLKAVARLWNVFVDPAIKATFKIDLDQVFPQERLLEETGMTAFQHLTTPLWGAEGVDCDGRPVYLGMLAGALVNERDIERSLFTPDVTYPSPPFRGERALFCSAVPQALSTVSEMMTRYDGTFINGRESCIHRIHITGGTTGILIPALRTYRPFTPTFINRAEDQAYLLSVLFDSSNKKPLLRYIHKDGFFMRHDKHTFAQEAIKTASIGKLVGDYERVIFFSHYSAILPWDMKSIKDVIDPFTGSFVSPLPFNVACLRLALKGAELFSKDGQEGVELVTIGTRRIRRAMDEVTVGDGLRGVYEREKRAWDVFYDSLDIIERALARRDPFAMEMKRRVQGLVGNLRIGT